MTHDRGAFHKLQFARCARGFTLQTINSAETTFAFDRIEDLAAWLVEQYGEPNPYENRKASYTVRQGETVTIPMPIGGE